MIQSEKEMTIVGEELKQRAYDGKWQRWVKYLDMDNIYSYTGEDGKSRVTMIPEQWVVVGVYDYLLTIEE